MALVVEVAGPSETELRFKLKSLDVDSPKSHLNGSSRSKSEGNSEANSEANSEGSSGSGEENQLQDEISRAPAQANGSAPARHSLASAPPPSSDIIPSKAVFRGGLVDGGFVLLLEEQKAPELDSLVALPFACAAAAEAAESNAEAARCQGLGLSQGLSKDMANW